MSEEKPKRARLTQKQLRFAQNMANGAASQTQAARDAGYSNAGDSAYKLLKDDEVTGTIDELKEKYAPQDYSFARQALKRAIEVCDPADAKSLDLLVRCLAHITRTLAEAERTVSTQARYSLPARPTRALAGAPIRAQLVAHEAQKTFEAKAVEGGGEADGSTPRPAEVRERTDSDSSAGVEKDHKPQ